MTNNHPNGQHPAGTFELYAEELPDSIDLAACSMATVATQPTLATFVCYCTLPTAACFPTISTIAR
jgi:hypothetical protein